jgi:hypothetical protein
MSALGQLLAISSAPLIPGPVPDGLPVFTDVHPPNCRGEHDRGENPHGPTA